MVQDEHEKLSLYIACCDAVLIQLSLKMRLLNYVKRQN